jgi:hypothetical protein
MKTHPTLGGMFGKETIFRLTSAPERFPGVAKYCFFNGRSALFSLLRNLNPRSIWLPAYLCATVMDAVQKARVPCRFYPISRFLEIGEDGWMNEIGEGDLVCLIDYFGFKAPGEVFRRVRQQGGWTLEDAAHAPFLEFEPEADFVIVSPRKLLGVAYGALLIDRYGALVLSGTRMDPESPCISEAEKAFRARSDYDRDGKEDWYPAYLQSVARQPIADEQGSDHCLQDYLRADWQGIAARRRENFRFLLEKFSDVAIYEDLPDEIVPLGFPVLLEQRDRVQQELFKCGIFCPIHWRLGNWLPGEYADSYFLQDRILTILCDHRIDDEGMNRLAREFAKALK